MKVLKFDHTLAGLILSGKKTKTWRFFDDKDLSVNDVVTVVDKVDPGDHSTWLVIGEATIRQVVEKPLQDITRADLDGHEPFVSQEAMVQTYRGYYGDRVTLETPVKVVAFTFKPAEPPTPYIQQVPVEKVIIYADGASRGNPGPSAYGYLLYDESDTCLVRQGTYMGVTTNNQAEYAGLKSALERALALGAHTCQVYMDSMLVINQMKKIFKVKNRDLWPIHEAVKELCTRFREVSFTQIPRELNKAADAMANEALDAHASDERAARKM